MRCRINYDTDPISLTVLAADGKEHQFMDAIGHDGMLEVSIETGIKHNDVETYLTKADLKFILTLLQRLFC